MVVTDFCAQQLHNIVRRIAFGKNCLDAYKGFFFTHQHLNALWTSHSNGHCSCTWCISNFTLHALNTEFSVGPYYLGTDYSLRRTDPARIASDQIFDRKRIHTWHKICFIKPPDEARE